MKFLFIILILFLIFFKKNIENFFSNFPYPPPSSIGRGSICPVSPLLNDKLPPCMNGFFCDPDAYLDFEEVGRCRKNTIRDNIFY